MPEKKTDVSSCSLRRYLESVSRRNIYKFLKFSMELSVGEPKSTNHLKKLICCFFFRCCYCCYCWFVKSFNWGDCIRIVHIYHKKSSIHVGKYTWPMDPMALWFGIYLFTSEKTLSFHLSNEKKPWLFRLYRGLYYPIYGDFNKPI